MTYTNRAIKTRTKQQQKVARKYQYLNIRNKSKNIIMNTMLIVSTISIILNKTMKWRIRAYNKTTTPAKYKVIFMGKLDDDLLN
jgi:hypothetical protein